MQHTEDQFDTLWEDCLPEPDGEARRCIGCERLLLADERRVCNPCLQEEEEVRKMPTCGQGEWPGIDNTTGKPSFCILPVGHKGEHACIPDGLTL